MMILYILERNIKWRFHNAFTIVVTILQPLLWLVLYSSVAAKSMGASGVTNYTAFIVPGLVVLVTFSTCSSSGIMNYIMKNDGSFNRLMIAPVSKCSIISGQLLEGVMCTLLESFIMFVTSIFFKVRINSGPFGVILIVIVISLTAFFMSGIAYAVSLSLPNEMIYETVMNAIVLPVFFLSTALFPADQISGTAYKIISLNPFTYVIEELRSLVLYEDIDYFHFAKVAGMLLVMCVVSFGLANYRLNKQTDL